MASDNTEQALQELADTCGFDYKEGTLTSSDIKKIHNTVSKIKDLENRINRLEEQTQIGVSAEYLQSFRQPTQIMQMISQLENMLSKSMPNHTRNDIEGQLRALRWVMYMESKLGAVKQ